MYARAARAAEDRGYTSAPAEATLGRVVRQHVEGGRDEVYELELGDRAHAHEGRAARRADNRRLRDRRVNHASLAELVQQTVRHLERAAVRAHVLADEEHRRVALHLLPDALAYGLDERDHAAALRSVRLVLFLNCG